MPINAPERKATIRTATSGDAAAICEIYNHYIANTIITFEEQTVTAEEMLRRQTALQATSLPWLVAESEGHLLGYAYASPWKARSAYRFTVESTVYLQHDCERLGIGTSLYASLLSALQAIKVHVVVACVSLPNDPSVGFHEHIGFKKVAHFSEVGFKFERFIDVGYWQLTLGPIS